MNVVENLLLHPRTQQQLDALINRQPHAILITGKRGSGKKTVALHAAIAILHIHSLKNYPYFLQIMPENNSIGIETIRKMKTFLNKKTTGTFRIRRIILVCDAHTMTVEAQNALLKVLEEPPADTMILLTSSDRYSLKPTITSRVQHISVLPVTKAMAIKAFKNDASEGAITIAYHISGGQVGLMFAMLHQKADHEMVRAVNTAKEFLKMDTYHRLLQTDGLVKQKKELGIFLDGLQRVVTSGLEQAALKDNSLQVKKFYGLSSQLQDAQIALSKNANVKLVLDKLFVNM